MTAEEPQQPVLGDSSKRDDTHCPALDYAPPCPTGNYRMFDIPAEDWRSVAGRLGTIVLALVIDDDPLDEAVGAQVRQDDAVGGHTCRGQQGRELPVVCDIGVDDLVEEQPLERGPTITVATLRRLDVVGQREASIPA